MIAARIGIFETLKPGVLLDVWEREENGVKRIDLEVIDGEEHIGVVAASMDPVKARAMASALNLAPMEALMGTIKRLSFELSREKRLRRAKTVLAKERCRCGKIRGHKSRHRQPKRKSGRR